MTLYYSKCYQYFRKKLKFITYNRVFIFSLFIANLLKFRNLGHKTIKYWDELFHAIVARNLMKHFFKPTLLDQPYLPYDYTSWMQSHVWLHKPPIPLWQTPSHNIYSESTRSLSVSLLP